MPQSPDSRDAYLVVREGNSWRDIFRLSPTQVMTIGRATTNRIVLRDELCSRNHCELYRNGSTWVVRDLGSRNGTTVNGGPVVGERELESGDLIQIGPYELGFTFNLGEPFPQKEPKPDINESDTASRWMSSTPNQHQPSTPRLSTGPVARAIVRKRPCPFPAPTERRASWPRSIAWRSTWGPRGERRNWRKSSSPGCGAA